MFAIKTRAHKCVQKLAIKTQAYKGVQTFAMKTQAHKGVQMFASMRSIDGGCWYVCKTGQG